MVKKICIIMILFMNNLQVNGQKVHGFLFCKTNDLTIQKSVKLNYVNMQDLFRSIADGLGYEYIDHSLTGASFEQSKLNTLVEMSSIGEDDIVFLYFSTHGEKSKWDINDFPQVDVPKGRVSSYDIHSKISKKEPRLLVTLVEACSGYKEFKGQDAFLYKQSIETEEIGAISPGLLKKNLGGLFNGPCNIIVCAGQPGMDTWATDNGSIFTNSFLRAFKEAVSSKDENVVNWESILNKSKNYTFSRTKRTRLKHYPIWEIKDCEKLVVQSVVEKDLPTNNAQFIVDSEKVRGSIFKSRFRNVKMSINGLQEVDSVTYFLHHTMPNPTITLTNNSEDFEYNISVWGEFEIKARIYYKSGEIEEIIGEIEFNRKKAF